MFTHDINASVTKSQLLYVAAETLLSTLEEFSRTPVQK